MDIGFEETRGFWNRVADDWQVQVGRDGDANRRLNSDPVLWRLAGNVHGLRVLDAGCGTGYLSTKLRERGARVVGVDFSERMIDIARAADPDVEFYVDSCSDLATVPDASCDLVVSNYVLMDTPDLDGTVRAFHRVLQPDGAAIVVFSHPCFPAGRARLSDDAGQVTYEWEAPYFEARACADPPWGHFTSDFLWFHRPLSDYWKAFVGAGFDVADFEEPRVTEDRYHLVGTERALRKSLFCPYSVAFKLRKRPPSTRPT